MNKTFRFFYNAKKNNLNFSNFLKCSKFRNLSLGAKATYSLLIDAMSVQSHKDKHNHIFINYPVKQLMLDLSVSKQTAINYMAELADFGLIKKYNRGLGQAAIIYVMDAGLTEPVLESEAVTDIQGQKTVPAEVKKIDPINDNNYIHTHYNINFNNINNISNPILSQDMIRSNKLDFENLIDHFKSQLEVDSFCQKNPEEAEVMTGIVELLAETLTSGKSKLTICSRSLPMAVVWERFFRLTKSHVEYVIDCLNNTTTTIHNIKQYMLAALFNAPVTFSAYAKNKSARGKSQEEATGKTITKNPKTAFSNFEQREYDPIELEKMLLCRV
jgi:hypothetical protein